MKKVPLTIGFASLYLLFYQASPYIGIPGNLVIAMFVISPFLVIAMVYSILKYGKPSKYTFDERFYDDYDYERNGRDGLDS